MWQITKKVVGRWAFSLPNGVTQKRLLDRQGIELIEFLDVNCYWIIWEPPMIDWGVPLTSCLWPILLDMQCWDVGAFCIRFQVAIYSPFTPHIRKKDLPISSLLKGHFRCGMCKVCAQVLVGGKVTVPGRVIQLQSFYTRSTAGVVYLILCKWRRGFLRIHLKVEDALLVSHFRSIQHKEDYIKFMVLYVARPNAFDLQR